MKKCYERLGVASAYSFALSCGIDELLAEVLPVLVVRGFLHDDLPVVIRELKDDVLVHLLELQLVVAVNALGCDGSSG